MIRRAGWILLLAALVACSGRERASVRIATTTSVDHAGLLEVLRAEFLRDTGIEIEAFVVGSGRAVRMAERGAADLIITHEPSGEARLRHQGRAAAQVALFENRFLLVGPPEDPARLREVPSVLEAFRRIHATHAPFVSRGDESGTHVRELELWRKLGIDPSRNRSYRSMGQGMSHLLRSAAELQAYTLTDEATFARLRGSIRLVPVAREGEGLQNRYVATLVRRPGGGVDPNARRLFEWLVGGGAAEAVRELERRGRSEFRLLLDPAEKGGAVS